MIELSAVCHRYDQVDVLNDINLRLTEQRIGLVGANGSGKSTLARLCNGLIRPSQGQVLVNGFDTVRQLSQVRRLVGFVFQDPDLQIIMPTVAEDLAFSLRQSGLSKDQIRQRVTSWLDDYGLAGHADHPAHLLSGGQKQLLAIAAVLIAEPTIVVFDEPTTLLDLRNKARVMELITALPQQVIVVSHDLDLMDQFDRVIVIDQGRVAADDAPGPALASYRRLALGTR